MSVEGHQAKDGEDMQAFMNSRLAALFRDDGHPILEGRDFDARDIKENSNVAIVNQRFARHYFGDKSAVGRHSGRGGGPEDEARYRDRRRGGGLAVRRAARGRAPAGVRAELGQERRRASMCAPGWDPTSAYAALRNEVKKLDASMPVYEMKTLAAQLDQTLLTERLIALLSAGFGLLATLLAAIGLYGVMAFVVARRTKEMGLRMALGAQRGSVIWLVMKEVLLLLSIGLAIGIPAAIGLARYVSTQLYGVKASDPWIGGATMVVLSAGVERRRPDSGTPGQPDRSDSGAALRIKPGLQFSRTQTLDVHIIPKEPSCNTSHIRDISHSVAAGFDSCRSCAGITPKSSRRMFHRGSILRTGHARRA